MRWPEATELAVVDWSGEIFRHVWPGREIRVKAAAIRGDWRELPFADESFDIVFGDGCYSAFARRDEASLLNHEAARVLKPGGTFAIRCFALPDRSLTVERLFAELTQGKFDNPALFRWLVVLATHGDSTEGVALGAIWELWKRFVPDLSELSRLGWDDVSIRQLRHHEGQTVRYSFHSTAELEGLARPWFDSVRVETPAWEYGSSFPRLSMKRR